MSKINKIVEFIKKFFFIKSAMLLVRCWQRALDCRTHSGDLINFLVESFN